MEGDRGLASTRASLDDHRSTQRRTDDAVLFRLDGRDDVAHAAGARAPEGIEQRGLTNQHEFARVAGTERRFSEHLVVETKDLAAAGQKVPASAQTERIGGGRSIKGLRNR